MAMPRRDGAVTDHSSPFYNAVSDVSSFCPRGPTDKASAYGAEDSEFESLRGYTFCVKKGFPVAVGVRREIASTDGADVAMGDSQGVEQLVAHKRSSKEGRTRFFARGSLPCVAPSSLPRLLPPFLAWPWLVLCLVLASCLAHPSPRPCLFLCPVPCLVLLARFPLSRLLSISANDLSP